MRKVTFPFITLALGLMLLAQGVRAQNTIRFSIKDKDTREILPGATVSLKNTSRAGAGDTNGELELSGIPNGEQTFVISMMGYQTLTKKFTFPLTTGGLIPIFLEPESEELEDVQVSATRSSRVISDIPTRVETITSGELDEKAGMQSANIKMLLTESTGIQTQQTSAVSANTSIRIQGLDGKYTQLLKDGFPLYTGFSEGLSIMQVPPLDLKRAEVIKGSASTLYGGGAIAGLVNLVTKEPTDKNEFTVMGNYTSANGLDLNSYYSHKFNKTGLTVFFARNSQEAYDPDHDHFSDIPKSTLYNFNPTFYYYIDKTTTLSFGLNASIDDILGGDMTVINQGADSIHTYYQRNRTNRYSTKLKFEKIMANKNVLTFKNSVAYFSRDIQMPAYHFAGEQTSSFSELNYLIPGERSEWTMGLNETTDHFKETQPSFILKRDYDQLTGGAYIQNNFKVSDKFIVESGLRTDYMALKSPYYSTKGYTFILPRLSLLFKFTPNLTSRIGGGLGYKAPGIFDEETEREGFRNVMPLDLSTARPEHSLGFNFDINYKMYFDELSVSLNQMFFYTRITNPIVLNTSFLSRDTLLYQNANGDLTSRGFETNLKIHEDDFSVYFGYTFIDAQTNYDHIIAQNPLTARHRLYFTPMYEVENKIRIGYEVFYVSPQTLNDGEKVRDYWLMGISGEKFFKHFSLFVNFENMLDSRQSRWQKMFTGSIQNPQFGDIWAPTDGFVANAGLRIML